MRAIQVARYGERLKLKNVDIPKFNPIDQFLVKICYAPINPSDVYYVKGLYGLRKPLPTIGGFEGCGIIAEASDKSLIGRNVMCWADDSINYGTWADYFPVQKQNSIILDSKIEHNNQFDQYCSPFINPFTAVGFLDIVRKLNAQCVVLNAANSAVGRMSIKLFNNQNIKTIAIVRRQEQIQNLYDIGATHVLLSTNEKFDQELVQTIKQNKAKVFYDALGGEYSGLIFKNLENSGMLVGYGRFSNNKINDIDPIDLVFKQKEIKGFWLSKWYEQKGSEEQQQIKKLVENQITSTFSTRIQQTQVPDDDNINELIKLALNNSGQGKYVLDFTK
ncbi:trans-2-enoyl-CoA reductase, putative (macronuclear) [Tetrahymena thermophila SB210]|uniref:Trans-2-enoyl-CoA reductase, putative n=1 Tax=Tetrahymena thermophila (strain SB210) TaxID=312017 RepID=A4VCX9_TETTS|nr:trans-2-enoyl-CoA reductase, putative [Tetrahymena thermophila SB210]EDK31375.1 trans-2-enoyl-CoA reductase, putative [Tetrahymena thermophila SB210]|eukprot:XP_001471010.1 trans-2-enoyl-CoA reductase, putative [Tetrahymena thermophila SB210]